MRSAGVIYYTHNLHLQVMKINQRPSWFTWRVDLLLVNQGDDIRWDEIEEEKAVLKELLVISGSYCFNIKNNYIIIVISKLGKVANIFELEKGMDFDCICWRQW